jgi:hypothetical protein
MSDLANGLERQAYDQLRKARQYPAASTLRKLKEKHAKELFQEAKRLRVVASGHRSADFRRFGVRCRRLLEQNPVQALVGIRLAGQQKQNAEKTAKITKGLG